MQPVAGKEVVEELGAHQVALRHHVADAHRAAVLLQSQRDRVVELVASLVARQVGAVHVQLHAGVEAVVRIVPNVAGIERRLQQVEHQTAHALADLALFVRPGQRGHHTREQISLAAVEEHSVGSRQGWGQKIVRSRSRIHTRVS
jgi:hypothetical protein